MYVIIVFTGIVHDVEKKMPDLESMILGSSQVFKSSGAWLSTRKQNSRVLINVPA